MSDDENITARWATSAVSDGIVVEGLPDGHTMRVTGPQMATTVYRIGIILLHGMWPWGVKVDEGDRARLEGTRDAIQGKLDELNEAMRRAEVEG